MGLSPDAIIQAIATLIVGVIFLVTLRQAIGLRVTSRFILWIFAPIYFWTAAAAIFIFEDELAFVPNCAVLGCFTASQAGRTLFFSGLVALVVVVFLTYVESGRLERRGVEGPKKAE